MCYLWCSATPFMGERESSWDPRALPAHQSNARQHWPLVVRCSTADMVSQAGLLVYNMKGLFGVFTGKATLKEWLKMFTEQL